MSSFFVSHCNYAPELCIANLFKNDKKTNNSLNYFMILMDSKKCFWKVKINHIVPFTGAILEQVPWVPGTQKILKSILAPAKFQYLLHDVTNGNRKILTYNMK